MKYFFTTILILLSSFVFAHSISFYVAVNGRDDASGTSVQQALKTISKTQEKVKAYRLQHPKDTVYVYFIKGEYFIKDPIQFKPEDGGSGTVPVIYSALPNNKVIWNAGVKVNNWKPYNNNIWVADVPQIKNSNGSFKQLYVNGQRRTIATLPKQGFYRVKGLLDGTLDKGYQRPQKQFEYSEGDIDPNWKNLQDIDVVIYHFWTDTHLNIDYVDDKDHIVSFKYPSGKIFTDDFNNNGARYIVQNVFEGLQQPGEWYLDKKEAKLYYIPMKNEDMNKVNVYAPFAPAFINIEGDASHRQFVENLQFKNIQFQYANVQLPEGDVNNAQGSSTLNAVITMKGAKHCVFENCTITNTGGFAFDIQQGCSYNSLLYNQLSNLSGGGIRMNGGTFATHPLLQTHHNSISDNEIGYYGLDYPSAVGVLLMQTRDNEVVHNHIHDGFYTGISVGWEWGYQRSISTHNLIAYNHIHHIGKGLLSDMGAIYTLGVSPGTIIRNNLIHDVDAHNYGGWGIYNDEGSTHILIENNIVYNTKFACYDIHYAKEITVRNNIFAFGRLQQINRTRVEPHKSVYFENNIIYWEEGVLFDGNWDDKPYSFYLNPNEKNGAKQMHSTFDADYNIYFNPSMPADSIHFYKQSWKQWQARGKDVHSLISDPLFRDAANYNFTLKDNSPAYQLGFNPINTKDVGPRKKRNDRF